MAGTAVRIFFVFCNRANESWRFVFKTQADWHFVECLTWKGRYWWRGRKLGVLGKLGNLGESVFRGFQLRVFHFALYPKRKTRRWNPRSAVSSLFTKLRVFHFALYPKRKTRRWKPQSAVSSLFTNFWVFPTPSFPFCNIPKTENSEMKTSECSF